MKTGTSNIAECSESINKSPKTPGSITKTLLTPCRRVGLSRRWKSSKTPFISPVSNSESISSAQIDSTPNNRRKRHNDEENNQNEELINIKDNSDKTPLRSKVNKIKKSRSIVKKILNEDDNVTVQPSNNHSNAELEKPLFNVEVSTLLNNTIENVSDEINETKIDEEGVTTDLKTTESITIETLSEDVPIQSKLPRNRSNKSLKNYNIEPINEEIISKTVVTKLPKKKSSMKTSKKKNPNNLTSECIVVLGRTILKNNNDNNIPSQPLFESDIDEIPLSCVSKLKQNKTIEKDKTIIIDDDDNDFVEKLTKSPKLMKLEDKKTSTGDLRKLTMVKKIQTSKQQLSQTSNTSYEDDDDDDFIETRKNILRKSYTKTAKPIRAKTTGSITQRDIDDLKARIEMKKQMLLANTETKDTEELRALIKKWRKGCQDALSELMDIMKKKFPDKHNMDLSELLEMLKIPSDLVGYDNDHDCFKTPEEVDCLFNIKV